MHAIERTAIVCALLLAVPPAPLLAIEATARPPLWAGLAGGPHAVGFRTLDLSPKVGVWYPAFDQGERMRFRDYVGSGAEALSALLREAGAGGVVDALLESPLAARRAAPPGNGPFPLVLVAQGNGQDVADQVVLCEFLASHGFAVATTPSPMLATPMRREEEVGAFAERQMQELLRAVSAVAEAVPVASARLQVVGHSFGSRAALLLAMREPRVRGIVSLDGGIGTATAAAAFRTAPSFRDDARLPAILHFYEELDSFVEPDFTLLRSLGSERLELVPTRGMHHAHFTTYGFASAAFPEIGVATGATADTGAEARRVLEATLVFLLRSIDRETEAPAGSGKRHSSGEAAGAARLVR